MPPMRRVARFAGGTIVALATIGSIIGLVVALLLTPVWVFGEQDRVGSASMTGYTAAEIRVATGAILADLMVGPPDFDVTVRGQPVLNEAERGHLRDVRTVFLDFFAITGIAFIVLVIARWRMHGSVLFWQGVRAGSSILAVSVAALAGFALVAFSLLFEVFHELLFPPGSYSFNPLVDRLVQLFPEQFWFNSTVVLGIGLIVIGLVMRGYSGRRLSARRAETAEGIDRVTAVPPATPPAQPPVTPPATPPADTAPLGT